MPRLHPIQVVSTCIRIQVARPGYLYPATCIWCKRGLRVMMLSRTSDTTAVGVVILFVSVGVFVVVEMLTDDQLWTRRTRPVATGLSDSAHMRSHAAVPHRRRAVDGRGRRLQENETGRRSHTSSGRACWNLLHVALHQVRKVSARKKCPTDHTH